MCLYEFNRYAWYISGCVYGDIVRRMIIFSGVIRPRFEFKGMGYLGYPLIADAWEASKRVSWLHRMMIHLDIEFSHLNCGTRSRNIQGLWYHRR